MSSVDMIDLYPKSADLRELAIAGLHRSPRQLPAWLLYDDEGSRLFERICEQPEYSLTRTEIAMLEGEAPAISAAVGDGVMVEFGIGNALKVGPLLQALKPPAFVACDISRSALEASLVGLASSHPGTSMLGICCDYSELTALPDHPWLQGRQLIGFFPGSSLGNFSPTEAVRLLQQFRRLLNGGPLLLGLDQPKERSRLEAAYDDAAGVSAEFASNLLRRLNRDLEGDFKLDDFAYEARWQPEHQRIEMALVSRRDQIVRLGGELWTFDSGEDLITEHSYKYSPEAAQGLAYKAGWRITRRWHDPADDLSMHLLESAE
eukprot:Hpha_TRINITY_DN15360_c3_g11::TRINITY_DN15360_c3_g11_i1::g.90453::m.90453